MSGRLNHQSIIVTGAGRGIGAELAQAFAAEGAKVVVADVNKGNAANVAKRIMASGGSAISVEVDVRKRDSIRAMISAAVKEFGGLDTMVNNAGIAQVRTFLDISDEDWDTMLEVNSRGVLFCMQESIKQMLAQGHGGSVINMSSIAGKQGYPTQAHYCASKFGVVALTQAAAKAFGPNRIRVNAICPGIVATDMWKMIDQGFRDAGLTNEENEAFNGYVALTALGRPSTPADLTGVAVFLASHESEYMTGQTLLIEGGLVFD
ncbi:shikimate dehydrogenase [Bradyrhizobium brasilense]|uniref:SDR family NAD(P)-dependent oxidoreductase n=1 Tax=Bradyrhizobium brasilense TaxID=1419277 RepID=UPI00097545A9|nr:glucose 1-dehydrogenase [Bradyrhizobium brasilense]OMI00058.1 shikimate dehydrogenase [Bradyrhizobium brasilense]